MERHLKPIRSQKKQLKTIYTTVIINELKENWLV